LRFQMAEKSVDAPPRPSPRSTYPHLPSPLATPLGAKAKTVHLLSLLYSILTMKLNQINILT